MHNHSYENEFNLHVNEISSSYEKMSTKTRFEEEAKGNSEMAYLLIYLFSLTGIPDFSPALFKKQSGKSIDLKLVERYIDNSLSRTWHY